MKFAPLTVVAPPLGPCSFVSPRFLPSACSLHTKKQEEITGKDLLLGKTFLHLRCTQVLCTSVRGPAKVAVGLAVRTLKRSEYSWMKFFCMADIWAMMRARRAAAASALRAPARRPPGSASSSTSMGHWSVGPSRTRRKCRSVWSSSGFWLRTLGAAAHLQTPLHLASASPERVAAAVKAKKESAGGTPRSRRRCSSCRATPTRCRAFSSCVSEKEGQPGLLARRSTRLSTCKGASQLTPSMTSHWSRLTTVAKGRANSGGAGGRAAGLQTGLLPPPQLGLLRPRLLLPRVVVEERVELPVELGPQLRVPGGGGGSGVGAPLPAEVCHPGEDLLHLRLPRRGAPPGQQLDQLAVGQGLHAQQLDNLPLQPVSLRHCPDPRQATLAHQRQHQAWQRGGHAGLRTEELLRQGHGEGQVGLVSRVVAVLGPGQQAVLVQQLNQKLVALEQGGRRLQKGHVPVVRLPSQTHVVVEVDLVQQRVAVAAPHACPELGHHHLAKRGPLHELLRRRLAPELELVGVVAQAEAVQAEQQAGHKAGQGQVDGDRQGGYVVVHARGRVAGKLPSHGRHGSLGPFQGPQCLAQSLDRHLPVPGAPLQCQPHHGGKLQLDVDACLPLRLKLHRGGAYLPEDRVHALHPGEQGEQGAHPVEEALAQPLCPHVGGHCQQVAQVVQHVLGTPERHIRLHTQTRPSCILHAPYLENNTLANIATYLVALEGEPALGVAVLLALGEEGAQQHGQGVLLGHQQVRQGGHREDLHRQGGDRHRVLVVVRHKLLEQVRVVSGEGHGKVPLAAAVHQHAPDEELVEGRPGRLPQLGVRPHHAAHQRETLFRRGLQHHPAEH
ncbi:unnamed protein product, partial [Ixodes pacificus]